MPFKSKSKRDAYQRKWYAANRAKKQKYNASYYAACPEYWKLRVVAQPDMIPALQ